MYQMLSWRHPQYEGGGQEYGTGRRDNALKDLEDDIAEKESICSKAESLSRSRDFSSASKQMDELFAEWKNIFNWHTPKEKQLWERYSEARKTFYEQRERARTETACAKRGIIAEARSLASSNDWKNAGQRLKELMDQWKRVGSAGRNEDEILWQEFDAARKQFYERRSKHFEETENRFSKNKAEKQSLIAEARSVSQYSTDWKNTTDKLGEFMSKWKAVGSAGREYDERLWNEFCAIRQEFFDRKQAHYNEQKSTFMANAARKSNLVQEAASIAGRCDYSQQCTERMKDLDREWKSIGPAGKEQEQELWNSFMSAKDSFWSGKRSAGERRQMERKMKMQEAIGRKRASISNLEGQISNLRCKMLGMKNQEYINNMYGWIAEKEARIRELEMAIRDMESKL